MFRVPIRSRVGNAVLGVLGAIYFLSASGTLIFYIVTNWGANGLLDRALQLALAVSAVAGVFFIMIAADNLGIQLHRWSNAKSHTARDHQTAAATHS